MITLWQAQPERRNKKSEMRRNGGEEQAKFLTVTINSHKQKHPVSRFPGTGPPARELCPKAWEIQVQPRLRAVVFNDDFRVVRLT